MSEVSLVVAFASVEAIETALGTAQQQMIDRVTSLRSRVDAEIAGWRPGTASRDAQMGFDKALGAWVEDLSAALVSVAAALAVVREAAHDAEVRNVAIMD